MNETNPEIGRLLKADIANPPEKPKKETPPVRTDRRLRARLSRLRAGSTDGLCKTRGCTKSTGGQWVGDREFRHFDFCHEHECRSEGCREPSATADGTGLHDYCAEHWSRVCADPESRQNELERQYQRYLRG